MPHEIQPDRISPDARSTLDEIRRLQADRGHRDARRTFFVEGVRNVVHAIESGFRCRGRSVYSGKLLIVPIARRLVRDRSRVRQARRPPRLPPEAFRQVSTTPRACGGQPSSPRGGRRCTASRRGRGSAGLLLEASSVREGNLGSLIRTSEAVGGAGFILVGPRIDPYTPAVVRASMGALFRQAFIRTNDRSLRNWVRRHRCRVIGRSSSPDVVGRPSPLQLSPPDDPRPGGGAPGLTPLQRGLCSDLVRIPMVGAADSLNLAVAGSLLLYEVYRARSVQRGRSP